MDNPLFSAAVAKILPQLVDAAFLVLSGLIALGVVRFNAWIASKGQAENMASLYRTITNVLTATIATNPDKFKNIPDLVDYALPKIREFNPPGTADQTDENLRMKIEARVPEVQQTVASSVASVTMSAKVVSSNVEPPVAGVGSPLTPLVGGVVPDVVLGAGPLDKAGAKGDNLVVDGTLRVKDITR